MTNISVTLKTRSHDIVLGDRDGITVNRLIRLEDDTGYWLFEDDARIAWELGLGKAIELEKRSHSVKVSSR